MTIEKNNKNTLQHEESGFTTLLNSTMNNIKNTAALGVYCYLAGKPSGWIICKKELQNHFSCGREHIDTCMKFLKNIGAIEITLNRDNQGKCIGWTTVLKRKLSPIIQNTGFPYSGDDPHPDTPLSRIRVSRNTVKPESGFPAPIKERYIQKKEHNKPPIPPEGVAEGFPEFWNLYPKKKGRALCEAKWKQKNLDTIASVIIEKLKQQIELDDEWLRGYVPNPSTYISQARWEDEISKPREQAAKKKDKDFYSDHDKDTSWANGMTI